MNFDIDQLKKKIIYRSNYRGTKEMDKILSNFVVQHIDQMSISDLLDLEKLLNIDDNNLYNYYNNLETDIKFDMNKVNTLFKNFKFKEKK